jgi:hypothetical protein
MNTQGGRLVYASALQTLKRNGINPGRAVLSQSYLRLEAPLTTTQAQYTFDVLVNENTNPNYVTQQKLSLQDVFLASSIGVFMYIPHSSATSEPAGKLYSYPDPATTAFGATTSVDSYGLYNGYLSYTVNQRTIVTAWDLARHLDVPITQTNTTPTGTGATGIVNSINYANGGFFAVEPNLYISGSKKNVLQITLPAALATVTANSRVVCIMRGLLAQNITSVH